jgi:hypothetical protein
VNTSKYDSQTRKDIKLVQRSVAYRELQRRTLAERIQLETKLRERNEVIDRLKKKLVEVGCTADDVELLAA